jgi:hypothetical protein
VEYEKLIALPIVISDPDVPLSGGFVLEAPIPYVVSTSLIESPLPKNLISLKKTLGTP